MRPRGASIPECGPLLWSYVPARRWLCKQIEGWQAEKPKPALTSRAFGMVGTMLRMWASIRQAMPTLRLFV